MISIILRMVRELDNISLRGFWLGTRAPNLFIIALTQYMGALFLIDPYGDPMKVFTDIRLLILCSSTIMIAAAGYLINDYFDIKIDYINKPQRVVVGKLLKRRVVLAAHTILNMGGIVAGFLLSIEIGLINFFAAGLLWLYSQYLKRVAFIGNISISLLSGLALLVVSVLYKEYNWLLWLYVSFAFFFTLIREIIKDMEDLKGDITFGYQTLPVVLGYRKTKILIHVLSFLFVLGIILLLVTARDLRVNFLLIGLIFITVWYNIKIQRADTKKEFGYLSKVSKIIMIAGITSMLLFV